MERVHMLRIRQGGDWDWLHEVAERTWLVTHSGGLQLRLPCTPDAVAPAATLATALSRAVGEGVTGDVVVTVEPGGVIVRPGRGVSAVGRWEVSEEVAKAAPPSSVQEFIEGRGPWASKSEAE